LCGHNVAPSQKENTTPQDNDENHETLRTYFVNDYWWKHHYEKSNVHLSSRTILIPT